MRRQGRRAAAAGIDNRDIARRADSTTTRTGHDRPGRVAGVHRPRRRPADLACVVGAGGGDGARDGLPRPHRRAGRPPGVGRRPRRCRCSSSIELVEHAERENPGMRGSEFLPRGGPSPAPRVVEVLLPGVSRPSGEPVPNGRRSTSFRSLERFGLGRVPALDETDGSDGSSVPCRVYNARLGERNATATAGGRCLRNFRRVDSG